jgi:hypothetical protein
MLRRLNACPDLQEVVDQAVENMKTSHTGLKVWHQFARVATEDGIEDEKEQTAQLLHCVRHIVSIHVAVAVVRRVRVFRVNFLVIVVYVSY